ncbi:hypothetical protein PV11_03882 [Exophiala sideris]|uniref:Piwi domain-containing protein n=1 Tax=Exophiala sideris TaxID=1016849 RepID=A0A0D1YKY2_9EURO|nr:hypothetical protein PV11_03882 [Exophiala sideris]
MMSGRGYNHYGGPRGGNNNRGRNFQNNNYGNRTSIQDSLVGQMQNANLNDNEKFLFANHFAVSLGKTEEVYDYALTFREEGQATTTGNVTGQTEGSEKVPNIKKKRLVCLLLNDTRFKGAIATDYVTRLISLHELDICSLPSEHSFDYYNEYEDRPDPNCKRYIITISKPTVVSFQNLLASLSQDRAREAPITFSEDDNVAAVRALNIIFSYPSYRECFPRQYPPEIPRMTTSNGHSFYGVVTQRNQETRHLPTATGEIFEYPRNHPGGLYSIPGFTRSIRTVVSACGNIDLNINTTTACFWQHGINGGNGVKIHEKVQDLIETWLGRPPNEDWRQLNAFLKGLPVRLLVPVDGIDPFNAVRGLDDIPPQYNDVCDMKHAAFQNTPGTVSQYYQQHHHWVPNRKIFVVKIGKKADNKYTTIPADLLEVLPGRANQNQDEKPAGAIRTPIANYNMITGTGLDTFYRGLPGGAQDFGLSLDRSMVRVSVDILSPPGLCYGRRLLVNEAECRSGTWTLRGVSSFASPARGKRWTCFEMSAGAGARTSDPGQLDTFRDSLGGAFGKYGMSNMIFVNPSFPHGDGNEWLDEHLLPDEFNIETIELQFQTIKTQLQRLKDKGIDLAVIILPMHHIGLYSAIKRAGDHDVGIATVCHYIRGRNPWQNEPQTPRKIWGPNYTPDCLANICMKINLKLDTNAANQILHDVPDEAGNMGETILTKRSMIIGIDVTHPGAGRVQDSPSVAACVGSVNPTFSQWPASLRPNVIDPPKDTDTKKKSKEDVETDRKKESKEEVVVLDDMIFERLRDYYERNSRVPDQLIIYRDGVSESQFSMCANVEYTRICDGINNLYKTFPAINDPKPKIVLICAVKRNQTRLFPDSDPNKQTQNPIIGPVRRQADNKNPLPGCLVTDRITYGHGQDFFLVSQRAIQGTARPTHYNILVNQPGYTLEQIAKTTHHLCYLFGRSARSVGVCPAIYYADLAADRARCYVRKYYNSEPVPRGQNQDSGLRYDLGQFRNCLNLHPNMAKTMFYI